MYVQPSSGRSSFGYCMLVLRVCRIWRSRFMTALTQAAAGSATVPPPTNQLPTSSNFDLESMN